MLTGIQHFLIGLKRYNFLANGAAFLMGQLRQLGDDFRGTHICKLADLALMLKTERTLFSELISYKYVIRGKGQIRT